MWDVHWGVLISHRGVEMALWAPLAPPRVPLGSPPRGHKKSICQSEGLTERINEPPSGRCLQGAVDVRWVVVVVVVVVVASQGVILD